jgi:hypothetical protein
VLILELGDREANRQKNPSDRKSAGDDNDDDEKDDIRKRIRDLRRAAYYVAIPSASVC